jgi:hypothetical protein
MSSYSYKIRTKLKTTPVCGNNEILFYFIINKFILNILLMFIQNKYKYQYT